MNLLHGKYYKIKIWGTNYFTVGRFAEGHGAFFYAREKFKSTYYDLVFLKEKLPSSEMKWAEEILEEVEPKKHEQVEGLKIWGDSV